MKWIIVVLFLFSSVLYSQDQPHKFDWKFWTLVGADAGATAGDIWITHDCLQAKTCIEGNPLMPSSLGGQIGLNVPLFSSQIFTAMKLHKEGSKLWWIPLISGTATHGTGIGVTLTR